MRRPLAPARARSIVPLAALVLTLAACTPPQGTSGSNPEPSQSTSPSASSSPSASPETGGSGANQGADVDAVFAQGLPPGVSEQTPDTPGGAGWSVDGTELYVVTFGSSSCPTVANEITVVEGASLAVELIETGGAVCTADYSPTTSTVAVPDGIDNAVPQVLTIGELGEVTVPPATGGVVVAWLPLQNP